MTPVEWLLSNDTGISSKLICSVMTGCSKRTGFDACTPSDPDDFGRCYRLLKRFPSWEADLWKVSLHYPKWRRLIDAWPELTTMYMQISDPDGLYTWDANKDMAQAMYNRMNELNSRGRT